MGWVSKKIADAIERSKETDSYWVEKAKLDFAIELDRTCKAAEINGKTLAEKLGTSAAYISKMFRGDANLTIESMVKLARATGSQIDIKLCKQQQARVNTETTVTKSSEHVLPSSNYYPKNYLGSMLVQTPITQGSTIRMPQNIDCEKWAA